MFKLQYDADWIYADPRFIITNDVAAILRSKLDVVRVIRISTGRSFSEMLDNFSTQINVTSGISSNELVDLMLGMAVEKPTLLVLDRAKGFIKENAIEIINLVHLWESCALSRNPLVPMYIIFDIDGDIEN